MDTWPLRCLPERKSDSWTTGRFSLVLALLIGAAFPDVLIGAKTFVFRDYMLFGYSIAHYHRESFWAGEVPLWNPLSQCGLPFLAQWNTMVLYPLSFIYLLLPLPWSLGFFCLVHLFVGGLGMYLLARRWTHHGLASSVAGVAYAFNGLTLSCLIYPNNIAGLGWLPWVVLLVERGWREGNRMAVLAALVAATQMLAGAPEVFLLTWLLLFAIWLGQFALGSTSRLRMILRPTLIIGLLACLTAVQVLPLVQLLGQSQRQEALYESNRWPLPGTGWANLLVPLFRSIRTPLGAFLQAYQGWISSTYLGAAILALALATVWVVRRRAVWFFGTLLAASLILALGDGGPLYPWLRKVFPQIAIVRYPVKFVILAACVVPLLAAFGVAHFLTSNRESRRTFGRATLCLVLSFCGLIAGVIGFAFLYPGIDEKWKWTFLSGASRTVFLTLIPVSLFAIPVLSQPGRRFAVQASLLLLIFLDGITHSPTLNPRVDPQAYTLGLPPLLEMNPRPERGHSRAGLTFGAMWGLHTTLASTTFDTALVFRMGLYANANLIDQIPKTDGCFALSLNDELKFRQQAFRLGQPVSEALADFMAISQMCPPGTSLNWTNRPTAMPMVTAGQRPEFATPARTFAALFEPEFDPRTTVYLPLSAKGKLQATHSTKVSAFVKMANAHRWVIEVNAAQPAMLVVAQAYYPAWTARVDGKAVPIWKANWTFQALEVPAGPHEVTLQYEDRAFQAGLLISGIGLGACAALLWWFRARTRKQVPELGDGAARQLITTPRLESDRSLQPKASTPLSRPDIAP